MKFIAIDPSSTILGWAIFEDTEVQDFGIIDTKKVEYDRRYTFILEGLRRLKSERNFTEIACERAIRFKGKRVPALEVAVTSIRKWAKMDKIPISFYSSTEWKYSVTGKGHADKELVARTIYMLMPKIPRGLSDHITDAISIGQHHSGIRRLEEMAHAIHESYKVAEKGRRQLIKDAKDLGLEIEE